MINRPLRDEQAPLKENHNPLAAGAVPLGMPKSHYEQILAMLGRDKRVWNEKPSQIMVIVHWIYMNSGVLPQSTLSRLGQTIVSSSTEKSKTIWGRCHWADQLGTVYPSHVIPGYDTTLRFCVGLPKLDRRNFKDRYLLPWTGGCLYSLGASKVFTISDSNHRYCQVLLRTQGHAETSLATHASCSCSIWASLWTQQPFSNIPTSFESSTF